jgi:hypothetical protein
MPSLSETQRRTLAAFADRIIPEDDAKSASQIGAVDFIEVLLDSDLAAKKDDYLGFLERLTEANFAGLSEATQDQLLQKCEASPIFRLAAETIHEAYWTSATGQALVGFTVTD